MKQVATLAIVLLAVLVAGCGGSSDEGAGAPEAGQEAGPQSSGSGDGGSSGGAASEGGSGGASEGGAQQAAGEADFKEITQGDFVLRWRVEGEDLHIVLRHPTTGWLAVGFDPTRMMKDANMILGYVSGGEVFLSDEYGTGNTAHRPDTEIGGTNDILYAEGSEGAGGTELRFAIPLDSGDSADRPLVPGNGYRVLLAHGPAGADDFRTYHGGRAAVEIQL